MRLRKNKNCYFIYFIYGLLLSMVFSGCQQPASTPPDTKASEHLTVTANDDTVVIDDATARILKRHSIQYQQWAQGVGDASGSGEAQRDSGLSEIAQSQEQAGDSESQGGWRDKGIMYVGSNDEATEETGKPVALTDGSDDENKPIQIDPALAEKTIAVNFDQADIRTVIKTVSDITGINFIVDESIKGTVTVLSPTEIRVGELYRFLESILMVKGYAAVPAGDHVKIIPQGQAVKQNLRIRVGNDPSAIPQDDSIITQMVVLQYAKADEISELLRSRLTPGGSLTSYPRTNTILITDVSSNIHQLVKIVRQMDVSGAKEKFAVIPLHYASAQGMSEHLNEILSKGEGGSSPPGRGDRSSGTDSKVQIQPDMRINALLVTATRQDIERIYDMVKLLDVERPAGADHVHVEYLKNAEANEVAESLSLALANLKTVQGGVQPQVYITPDAGTNALIINAYPQDYEVIRGIIRQLDIIREQVLVELLIVEVSGNMLREIGVDWATLDQAVSNSIRVFGNTNFGIRVDAASGNLGGLSVGTFKDVGGNVQVGTILAALERESGVNILSTPHLLTSNHKEAEILVGDNIPYVTQSRITETDPSTPTVIKTIDYKDVGVKMKITPHISQGGLVRLEIDSEVTKLVESLTGLTEDTPTTSTRKLKTEISMPNGSTVVIGGLIRDDKVTREDKVPLIGDIPIIGELFKFRRDQVEKTNLLLFITPYVLRSEADMANMTQRKQTQIAPELGERMKDENDGEEKAGTIWR